MEDLGLSVKVQVNTDSSAAKSITARKGAGRVRQLRIVKVRGEDNVANGLTKHVDMQKMEQYMEACGSVRKSGIHEFSPALGESI